jgi:hypothetical protein
MSKPWGQIYPSIILDTNFRDLSDKDIRAYIFLRAMAIRSPREGFIEQYKDHPYKIETLADIISFDKDDLNLSIQNLANPKYDILEILANGVLHFKHWDEEEITQEEREKKYAEIKKKREHAKRKTKLAIAIHDASTTVDYLDNNPEFTEHVKNGDIKEALNYIIKNVTGE